jgi:nucleotide-binding universal stress UspA family protein
METKEVAMIMVDKILFPVDLSEVAPLIVPWVKELAQKFQAEIHVVFVARAFEHYAGLGVPLPYIDDFETEVAKQGEKRLEEFMEEHFYGARTLARVVPGNPAEKIVEYAEEEGIDLIAMGTHGRKGLEKIVFGSVAEQVLKNSMVPVLTVNPYKQVADAA